MFLSRNKKNNVYPCKPQFYYIKVVSTKKTTTKNWVIWGLSQWKTHNHNHKHNDETKQRAQWRSEARTQETTNRTTVGLTTDINSYCPFDISRKDVFCLAFCFKRRHFFLIDHILSETFIDSVFSSQIFTVKLDLRQKKKKKKKKKKWSYLRKFYS